MPTLPNNNEISSNDSLSSSSGSHHNIVHSSQLALAASRIANTNDFLPVEIYVPTYSPVFRETPALPLLQAQVLNSSMSDETISDSEFLPVADLVHLANPPRPSNPVAEVIEILGDDTPYESSQNIQVQPIWGSPSPGLNSLAAPTALSHAVSLGLGPVPRIGENLGIFVSNRGLAQNAIVERIDENGRIHYQNENEGVGQPRFRPFIPGPYAPRTVQEYRDRLNEGDNSRR
jgi:hypothetical protein